MHLITGLNAGGAEKVVLDLCTIQQEEGRNPLVVSITGNKKLEPLFIKNGITPIYLSAGRNLFSLIKGVKDLSRIVRKNGINILHCHLFHPLVFAYLLKFLNPSLKIVFTSHSFNIGSRVREFITWITKGLRDADVVFSAGMKSRMYKQHATEIIPNGINFASYAQSGQKNQVFTFICIARLDRVKNHMMLLEAVSMLSKDRPFEMWLVGDGELREQATQFAAENGLEKHVKFLGYRSDIPDLLRQTHCFILPSLWEGLPISILEACAASVPVISTSVGSIPDFFSKEEILYTDTTAESIAQNMAKMMDHYDGYVESAVKLHGKAHTQFDLHLIGEKYIGLYRSLLQ
ncbi:glycosyltransferase [Chitinophaga sp. YR627]|uniref:glycosyltransferase n=1 Tax=Chitinophaga sp. YR627 TaxID=1881041 RepID=UPI0015A55439|nr:glycosyltransferase [Chitinophaga sp. YR627]